MPDYRRYRVPDGTYFFTINLLERCSGLLTHHIDGLREAVQRTRRALGRIVAFAGAGRRERNGKESAMRARESRAV